MKKTIKEELERFRTLSFYNSNLTLSENIENNEYFLNEALPFTNVTRQVTAQEVGGAFKNLGRVKNDWGILRSLSDLTSSLAKTEKEFIKELKGAIAKDLKAGTKPGDLGNAMAEIAKIDSLRRIVAKHKSLGGKTKLTAGEVDEIFNQSIKDIKSESLVLKPRKVKVKPTPEEEKAIQDALKNNPDKAKLPWKSLLKWGAGIGLTMAVLYGIYRAGHGGEDPPVVPDDVTPPPPPAPSQYKSCPDTFPIAMYCKNETIRKVQGCLGVATDTAFGPKTQAALEAKGLTGTEITQDTVDKVCGGGTTPTPFQDDDAEDTTSNQSTQSADDADEA